MKEALVEAGTFKVRIVDSPVPEPGPEQLVIKVVVSGSNPKDWKYAKWTNKTLNSGDDIAGIVHAVGSDVWEFKKGDRVASFHEMMTAGGSFAEYAVGWQHTTFKLPDKVSFEEASTIPLAAMTAAIGLHISLALPAPWTPPSHPIPLVVYGGASAVGAFAIKLATKAGIHPIIAVAGRGAPYVETLLDRAKGDTIIDYRLGSSSIIQGIRDAVPSGLTLAHAFDATSEHNSYQNIAQAMGSTRGAITTVLPANEKDGIPETIGLPLTMVGDAHTKAKDFAYLWFRYFARGLGEGWFRPHPFEVVEGGLEGVQRGLDDLREGKASAVKFVFRVGDTPGLG
ncbi:zinc-binding oxidoreductase-like protein ToxD [Massariosphaeria phaeospora]|uniref:Zinc-binding oxidoreductase-like protein ToxD n=1 Tax=Massariosphaeria phaeospora TaxID=100035 RepID=A0A7C8MFT5_9PLEO|nr:zinc-binding oxidoreductase-like protein ToxD [Massariosphaeria phaeospora]